MYAFAVCFDISVLFKAFLVLVVCIMHIILATLSIGCVLFSSYYKVSCYLPLAASQVSSTPNPPHPHDSSMHELVSVECDPL